MGVESNMGTKALALDLERIRFTSWLNPLKAEEFMNKILTLPLVHFLHM
jgi:hypothetical protein